MDDPEWSWPAWKFGMKRDELFTTLHDQYNTFSFSIQDPEAFHHDVYEISRDASTTDEFHRLMATRQQQRLRELNESLESLAVEIIANPKLMATHQWQYALQLFRTKSYDSIVRYFASYLPDDYLSHDSLSPTTTFSETDSICTTSTKASSVDGTAYATFLDQSCCSDGPVITEEPYSLDTIPKSHSAMEGPLSPPESEVTQSDLAESLPAGSDALDYDSHPRSRSMSFSGSESERFCPSVTHALALDEDETSQSDDTDAAISSPSDCGDSHSSLDSVADKEDSMQAIDAFDDDFDFPTAQLPEDSFGVFDSYDTLESDTPTPRQEPFASSYTEYKPAATAAAARRLPSSYRRSPSPSSRIIHPHGGDGGVVQEIRRSPEEALSKVQKSSADTIRKRAKDRRRMA
ncbi:hypothetical protein S40293_00445 [Stachybotrys chartarum IBT 40293]|nr:hypothetical protein S40293_00445 [Stachybotrys chartarum IBT 40293]